MRSITCCVIIALCLRIKYVLYCETWIMGIQLLVCLNTQGIPVVVLKIIAVSLLG